MGGESSRLVPVDDGGHNAERQQAHHIVQRHNLQQGIYELSPGFVLIDCHHGAGRRRGRGDGP